jgi:Oxidoreductase family, C-terminal alpha/beta domain
LTEICLLGVAAQRTGQCLQYDSQSMRFTNDAEANQLLDQPYRAGWSL